MLLRRSQCQIERARAVWYITVALRMRLFPLDIDIRLPIALNLAVGVANDESGLISSI